MQPTIAPQVLPLPVHAKNPKDVELVVHVEVWLPQNGHLDPTASLRVVEFSEKGLPTVVTFLSALRAAMRAVKLAEALSQSRMELLLPPPPPLCPPPLVMLLERDAVAAIVGDTIRPSLFVVAVIVVTHTVLAEGVRMAVVTVVSARFVWPAGTAVVAVETCRRRRGRRQLVAAVEEGNASVQRAVCALLLSPRPNSFHPSLRYSYAGITILYQRNRMKRTQRLRLLPCCVRLCCVI